MDQVRLVALGPLERWCNSLTCDLVDEDSRGDDATVLREKLLQLLLGHGFGQTTHIQVSVSDGGRTRTGVGHLMAQHTGYTRLNNFTMQICVLGWVVSHFKNAISFVEHKSCYGGRVPNLTALTPTIHCGGDVNPFTIRFGRDHNPVLKSTD